MIWVTGLLMDLAMGLCDLSLWAARFAMIWDSDFCFETGLLSKNFGVSFFGLDIWF